MIITVVAVRMMQSTLNDVVDMIAVRHRLMPAARAMDVVSLLTAGQPMLATVRVSRTDRDDMLIVVDSIVDLVRMMQMTIMQVVNVVFVPQALMAAAGAMNMIVMGMGMTVLAH